MRKKTLRVGVAPLEQIRQRSIDIAAGRRRSQANEPKIWFTSLASLARVISEPSHGALREIIRSERR